MAIKATLVAALLVALVAVASATSSYDDERGSRQCSRHVQGRDFRSCQTYLQLRRDTFVEMEMEEEEAANPQRRQLVQQCCDELREMDRQQCGCEAIRRAVREAQQGGRSYQTGQSEHIYERARALPRTCGLRQQQCRFNLVFL